MADGKEFEQRLARFRKLPLPLSQRDWPRSRGANSVSIGSEPVEVYGHTPDITAPKELQPCWRS